jgi:hypothetical protein
MTNTPAQRQNKPSNGGTVLRDNDFIQWLEDAHANKHTVVLAYAGHQCKVFDADILDAPLISSDPDKGSAVTLKKLAKAGLLNRIELSTNDLIEATIADQTWKSLNASQADVTDWIKKRDAMFGQGRGKAISESTAKQVWHAAAGRCMYRGCGNDLGKTSLTTKHGRIAYLAHIVASDPDGPRGDSASSHALSDDHENIMLMCDAHHRLIDRIDEAGHPVELLRNMRQEHEAMVRKMLDGLAFPRAQAITLLGNIANIPTFASEQNIRASLLARKLGPLPDIKHTIRRIQRDDRLLPDFWEYLLHEHELEIRDFVQLTKLTPLNGNLSPDVLAIFPLHLVPILVLAGRIVGEARRVEIFQYDRHRNTWQWDSAATALQDNSFQITEITSEHADEVLLSLELTATIDERALPPDIGTRVHQKAIPWIRITTNKPDSGCIRHPDDLEQFTIIARKAVQKIQDGIRPSRIHLLGVSPASTLFRFGQLLQAGHHPAYVVYDRPDHNHPFTPGLCIEGQQVTSCASDSDGNRKIIQLR